MVMLVFFFALYLPVQPSGQIIQSGWSVESEGKLIPIELPYQKSIQAVETVVFRNSIQYCDGQALVFSWPRGQAVAVTLNGETIFSMGDAAQPSANIWNKTFLIQLPAPEQEENELVLRLTSGSYPISLSIAPYILDLQRAQRRVALIDFLYQDLLLISMGSAFLTGFLLILMSMIQKKSWSAEFYLGLASLLGALEGFDYAVRVSSGSLASFLVLKKVLMIAGYLACLFFVAGLEQYYHGRLRFTHYLALPNLAAALLVAWQPDLIRLANLLPALNVILLAELIIAVVLIIAGKRGGRWLIIPAVWLLAGLLQMIIVQIFQIPWPYVMQNVLLASTVMFGINKLIEFNRIYSDKLDLERRIDLDVLTTAYNRNVLEKTIPEQYDVLILMDLDHFKAYNDCYGHLQGDKILVAFTKIIKKNLRAQDAVIRYGGDEFLVLLSEISLLDAEQVAQRIQHQFEEIADDEQLSVSYGIEKIEHSIDSDLNKADRLMYAMKHAKHLQSAANIKKPQQGEK